MAKITTSVERRFVSTTIGTTFTLKPDEEREVDETMVPEALRMGFSLVRESAPPSKPRGRRKSETVLTPESAVVDLTTTEDDEDVTED